MNFVIVITYTALFLAIDVHRVTTAFAIDLTATAIFCEGFCMEKIYVRSRSEATASIPAKVVLTMHHLGRDDIKKQQRSFVMIATIFIGNWSDENHLFK